MKRLPYILLASAGALLAACDVHGLSNLPGQNPVNVTKQSSLEFAVGTAQLQDGSLGLNVVATFRQPSGLSTVLVDTPTITGPGGFVVPSYAQTTPCPGKPATCLGGSGIDAGTNRISGTPQNPNPSPSPPPTTFGMSGGVFGAGFAPFNAGTSGVPSYPGAPPPYELPFYTATVEPYIIGPPAVPFFDNGTQFTGFWGYLAGFSAFQATPTAGNYNLNVIVPTSGGSPSFTKNATLSNLTPLPKLPTPTFSEDGKGGGTATLAVPSGPRILETLLFIVDPAWNGGSTPLFYTVGPATGTGTLTFTLPDNLGLCTLNSVGCQNTVSAGPSLQAGDAYSVYAASFDYPQFEAEPPGNTSQTPMITGPSGQADVSLSPTFSATY